MAYDYDLLRSDLDDGVLFVTIDNPPINLMTRALFAQLAKLSAEVAVDDEVRVLVLQSALPDFFIAHFDVEAILQFPTDGPAAREDELGGFHRMCEAYRTMPKATICKIAGRVGGGGSELAASCDMRFAAREHAVVCQMEVPLGIIPGGSGCQRLPWLVGRARAMEMVLGGIDVDAETGERWGYFNRVFPADELDAYVDALARRIASFPPEAVRLAKAAVLGALPDPRGALVEEAYRFQQAIRAPGAAGAMRAFLDLGGQTERGELDLQEVTGAIGSRRAPEPP